MKINKKRKAKFSIKEAFGLKMQSLQSVMHLGAILHINCHGDVCIENCKSIVLYTENEVQFDMGNIIASIKGDGITIETMEKNLVTVHGRIFCAEFLYSKGCGLND